MSALTILYFYPRSPCGERPVTARIIDPTFGFLSTLSLRRATNNVLPAYAACGISIHALLAESDEAQDGYKDTVTEFLSTLSLRRATSAPVACGPDADISIHALLAESDATTANKALQKIISIHALLAESDGLFSSVYLGYMNNLYPRSPCGERPLELEPVPNFRFISIHALLAESDAFKQILEGFGNGFLSTLSLRRATESSGRIGLFCHISIHALLAESDGGVLLSFFGRIIFLSTLSLRRATTLR